MKTNLPFCPGLPQCRSGYVCPIRASDESLLWPMLARMCAVSSEHLHFYREEVTGMVHASGRSTCILGNVSFSHTLIVFAHESGHSCGFLPWYNDVANDASILPTNLALEDRLCTWLQCLLSKALVHKSPKAREPEVEVGSAHAVSRCNGVKVFRYFTFLYFYL